jgi:hypothetical protein
MQGGFKRTNNFVMTKTPHGASLNKDDTQRIMIAFAAMTGIDRAQCNARSAKAIASIGRCNSRLAVS